MKPLFDISKFEEFKRGSKLPFECEYCHEQYLLGMNMIRFYLKTGKDTHFCSKKCRHLSERKSKTLPCEECGKLITRRPSEFYYRYKKFYCSRKCLVIYNNKHKTWATRRSKLEVYLEGKLKELYPSLEIHFCRSDTINAELDIYIPSLKLAFELNGIYHYEPIFGQHHLDGRIDNDKRKFQACLERNIELCIIDVRNHRFYKEKSALPYLEIVTNLINVKLPSN